MAGEAILEGILRITHRHHDTTAHAEADDTMGAQLIHGGLRHDGDREA